MIFLTPGIVAFLLKPPEVAGKSTEAAAKKLFLKDWVEII
jgi:hypothetical protein